MRSNSKRNTALNLVSLMVAIALTACSASLDFKDRKTDSAAISSAGLPVVDENDEARRKQLTDDNIQHLIGVVYTNDGENGLSEKDVEELQGFVPFKLPVLSVKEAPYRSSDGLVPYATNSNMQFRVPLALPPIDDVVEIKNAWIEMSVRKLVKKGQSKTLDGEMLYNYEMDVISGDNPDRKSIENPAFWDSRAPQNNIFSSWKLTKVIEEFPNGDKLMETERKRIPLAELLSLEEPLKGVLYHKTSPTNIEGVRKLRFVNGPNTLVVDPKIDVEFRTDPSKPAWPNSKTPTIAAVEPRDQVDPRVSFPQDLAQSLAEIEAPSDSTNEASTLPPVVSDVTKIEPIVTVERTSDDSAKITLSQKAANFNLNSAVISAESRAKVAQLIKLLQNYGFDRVRIVGHTDRSGTVRWNNQLSKMRADALAKLFVQNGVDANVITKEGKGSSEPVNGVTDINSYPYYYRPNRRVELFVDGLKNVSQAEIDSAVQKIFRSK